MRKNGIRLNVRKTNGIRQIFLQTGSLLALSMIVETFAGLILSTKREELLLIPGLIVLYPALSDLRGDIGTSLGSRICIGLCEKRSTSKLILDNVVSALLLSLLMSTFIGVISDISSLFLGLPSIGFIKLVMISLVSVPIASVIMIFFTVFVTLVSFHRGVDPDNIIAPSLATIGDIITVGSVFLSAQLVIDNFNFSLLLVEVTFALICPLFFALQFLIRRSTDNMFMSTQEEPSKIIFESIPSSILSVVLGVISGTILHMNMVSLTSSPTIVALVPLIVANAGIIGIVLAARLSNSVHQRSLDVWSTFKNALVLFTLGTLSSILISLLVYALLPIFGIPVLNFISLVLMSLQICLITSVSIIIFTVLSTLLSIRCGLDPCNIVIPVITSLGDIIGVLSLLGMASHYGFI